jgi:Protein of unknown function (DUF3108)
MFRYPSGLSLCGSLVGVLALVSGAAAGDVAARYTISLAGLSLGKAALEGSLNGADYSINVSSALTGLVGAVSKGRGAATARGSLTNGSVLTNGFSLSATNGKEDRTIQMAAASGSIRSVVIEPPFQDKAPEARVPLRDQHKLNVLDPVSALIMPVKGSNPLDAANCDRRLPVFDGSQRFDVVLSYAGTQPVTTKGYTGQALVCSARYVPVAGHRPERKVTKFMVENRNMDTWLVPVNGGKQLIPYRISVKTMIGTAVIEADSFNPG